MSAAATAAGWLYASGRLRGKHKDEQRATDQKAGDVTLHRSVDRVRPAHQAKVIYKSRPGRW